MQADTAKLRLSPIDPSSDEIGELRLCAAGRAVAHLLLHSRDGCRLSPPVTTSGAGNTSSGGGFGTVPAAGQANTGQFSIHGQRESDNAYYPKAFGWNIANATQTDLPFPPLFQTTETLNCSVLSACRRLRQNLILHQTMQGAG